MKRRLLSCALLLGLFLASGCSSAPKPATTVSTSTPTNTVHDVLSDPQFKQVVTALESQGK